MWLFIFHNQKESFLSFPQYGEPSTSDKWRLAFLTLYLVCARACGGVLGERKGGDISLSCTVAPEKVKSIRH